ncbi:MAG: adenosine deaminase [Armatimonadota bacterium]|nr:adenosine deaminase [Armatimonadota bacterium]MDR7451410.1 adenosine deaminase [Armatimonadota bacterium]MDR7466440.1 adenosine deaminase [Armatimonadota bacterium]MDR7493162.1 adenosine deaminase [Armatimonadota bacterium]MDR7500351.1 adenosine deaminase [Armatimonadota bacterium]
MTGSGVAAIRALPKIELHLHLETSLRLRRLAERRAATEPSPAPLIADPARFAGYDRLRRMRYALRAGRVPDALYTADNIETITYELLCEAAAHGSRYVEVRVGGRRAFELLGMRRMLEAMARARTRAEVAVGIRSGIIVTMVRERGPEEAERRVREALDCRPCGVVGVDLAGDEANYPPGLFSRPLALAREGGLGITVHAGEFAGPSSIWTAIYQLGARRIGHGIRAVEDRRLLDYLRDQRITLEICPTSNVRLGLVRSLAAHPLRRLVDAGVPVTINSDDPMLLGTDISQELTLVAQALALRDGALADFMAAAARAAFLPEEERRRLEGLVASPARRSPG